MSRCCLLFLLIPATLFCQTIDIHDSTGKTIVYFDNDKLVDAADKKTFVTVQGNTVFDGASEEKKDILLLITTENIFSRRKIGYALNAAQDEAVFTIRNGGFFYHETHGQMAYYEKGDDGSFVLFRDTS